MIHILRLKIRALAVHIQKAILGRRIEHRLPHGGVMGIRDVDDGQLNRDRSICHVGRRLYQERIRVDWV